MPDRLDCVRSSGPENQAPQSRLSGFPSPPSWGFPYWAMPSWESAALVPPVTPGSLHAHSIFPPLPLSGASPACFPRLSSPHNSCSYQRPQPPLHCRLDWAGRPSGLYSNSTTTGSLLPLGQRWGPQLPVASPGLPPQEPRNCKTPLRGCFCVETDSGQQPCSSHGLFCPWACTCPPTQAQVGLKHP